jgi:hypothetical protein
MNAGLSSQSGAAIVSSMSSRRISRTATAKKSAADVGDSLHCTLGAEEIASAATGPVEGEAGSDYTHRLNALGARIAKSVSPSWKLQAARDESTVANLDSATTDRQSVQEARLVIKNSRFNRLAAELDPFEAIAVEDLAIRWAKCANSRGNNYAHKAIVRLINQGVLEIVGEGVVRRSSHQVMLAGAASAERGGLASHRTALVTQRDGQLTPTEVFQALTVDPNCLNFTERNQHSFGTYPEADRLQAALLCGFGLSARRTTLHWSPAIPEQAIRQQFFAITGLSFERFRDEFLSLLTKDFTEKLAEQALRKVAEEAPLWQIESPRPNADSRTALEKLHSIIQAANGTQASQADADLATSLGIASESFGDFARLMMARLKHALFDLLDHHCLGLSLGEHVVKMNRRHALEISSIRKVDKEFSVSHEHVRESLHDLRRIHPIIQALLSWKKTTDERALTNMPLAIVLKLEDETRRDPSAAYERGLSVNPSKRWLEDESIYDYCQRVFVAAFAGAYRTDLGTPKGASESSPLRGLRPTPRQFFEKLAAQCANEQIAHKSQHFRLSLPMQTIQEILTTSFPGHHPRPELVMEYLQVLVVNPREKTDTLWRALAPHEAGRWHALLWRAFEGHLREDGKSRAKAALAVLQEPWAKAWLGNDQRINSFLEVRIIDQRSISETIETLGLPAGSAGSIHTRLAQQLPATTDLTPRTYIGSLKGGSARES